MTRIVYLHGFASSPGSSKAQYFKRRFAEHGIEIEIPQLDERNFAGLTITGQLRVTQDAVGDRAAILMGSSLGGYLAALFAARHPTIEKLVLLAPAFQFPRRWRERYTEQELAWWKAKGSVPVFHYGYKKEVPLGFQFMEDSRQYEDEPEFAQPALILHGRQDPVVPAAISTEYAVRRANVTLEILESGHELTDVLDVLWEKAARFLGVGVPFRQAGVSMVD